MTFFDRFEKIIQKHKEELEIFEKKLEKFSL